MAEFKQTACILCSENCGLEVEIKDGHMARIRGDRKHPSTQGYLCEKAQRLDYYQNHADRLLQPLRRRENGSFEEVSWDTAIQEIPENHLHFRHPILEAPDGPLAEQEIYLRLSKTIGADFATNPLLGPMAQLQQHPAMADLSEEMRVAAAPILMASMMYVEKHSEAVKRAGIQGEGPELGVALFQEIISNLSGVAISLHEYEDTFSLIETEDGKIHLVVESMLNWINELQDESATPVESSQYPFVLSAGERRSSNATTTYRNPLWRRTDPEGALHIHPEDAASLGVQDGDRLVCQSERGEIEVTAEFDEDLRPGHVTLPHGFGLAYAKEGEERQVHGPLINLLTASDHCDPVAKTPYHKHVPVQLSKIVV